MSVNRPGSSSGILRNEDVVVEDERGWLVVGGCLVGVVGCESKAAVASAVALAPAHGHGKVIDQPGARVILIFDPVTNPGRGVSVCEVLTGGRDPPRPGLGAEDEGDLQSEGHPLGWLPSEAGVLGARRDGFVEPWHVEKVRWVCWKQIGVFGQILVV